VISDSITTRSNQSYNGNSGIARPRASETSRHRIAHRSPRRSTRSAVACRTLAAWKGSRT